MFVWNRFLPNRLFLVLRLVQSKALWFWREFTHFSRYTSGLGPFWTRNRTFWNIQTTCIGLYLTARQPKFWYLLWFLLLRRCTLTRGGFRSARSTAQGSPQIHCWGSNAKAEKQHAGALWATIRALHALAMFQTHLHGPRTVYSKTRFCPRTRISWDWRFLYSWPIGCLERSWSITIAF